MGFLDFDGEDYYDSDAQVISESSAEAPYEAMLDYNICLLDGQISTIGWSELYSKAGKRCFSNYAKFIKHLEKQGDTTLSCYIAVDNSSTGADPDDTILEAILKDLGYTLDDVTATSIALLDPSTNTRLYIKAQLENYNYNDDNVVIDDIVYTIKSFEYKDISTIIVTLEDPNSNTIEKEIPIYTILDTSGDQLKASYYLYAEYTTVSDNIQHVFMQQVPVNSNNQNDFIYTDKEGNVLSYATKESYNRINILPLFPVKEGGYGQGWGPATMTAYRKFKRSGTWYDYTCATNYPFSSPTLRTTITPLIPMTGVNRTKDPKAEEFHDDKKRKNLYKRCKYEERRSEYKTYKKATKAAGMDIRQQIGVLYDAQCGFLKDVNGGDTADQIYSCYYGYGCSLHGVKMTNILQHPVEEYDEVYKRLVADTKNPFIAEYAKWSRWTFDRVLESDKEVNTYIYQKQHPDIPDVRSMLSLVKNGWIRKYFIEINKKKYKPLTMKALSHYLFNFFSLFDNKATAAGNKISIRHIQGRDYDATHTWTQYKKTSHEGKLRYKYMYGFSAQRRKQYYLHEIKFTGKYDVEKEYQAETSNWKLTYKPIYEMKSYACNSITEMENDSASLADLSGVPIQATYYDEEGKVLSTSTDENGNTIDYITVGVVTYTDPTEILGLTDKQLINIKETTSILLDNITFANATLTSTEEITNEDGTTTTTTHTKGTYATDDTEIYTANFYGTLDVTKLKYYADVMEYTEIKDGTEDTPPDASTDIPYDNFSTSFFPETETTYIVTDSTKGSDTDATFRYMYQYDATHYYEIKVTGYKVKWIINPYEDEQSKTTEYAGLAPDGAGFLPIVASCAKGLSLNEGVIVRTYALKQFWSFWVKQHVSWSDKYLLRIVLIAVVVVINIVITVATGGTAFSAQALLTQALISLAVGIAIHQVVKIFGLDKTVFGAILELAANIAAGYGLSNIPSLNFTFNLTFVGNQILKTLNSLTTLVLQHQLADVTEDYNKQKEEINDAQVEIQNAQNSGGMGIAQQAIVKRLRGQQLTWEQKTAISTTVVTDPIAIYCNMVGTRPTDYVKASTTVDIEYC